MDLWLKHGIIVISSSGWWMDGWMREVDEGGGGGLEEEEWASVHLFWQLCRSFLVKVWSWSLSSAFVTSQSKSASAEWTDSDVLYVVWWRERAWVWVCVCVWTQAVYRLLQQLYRPTFSLFLHCGLLLWRIHNPSDIPARPPCPTVTACVRYIRARSTLVFLFTSTSLRAQSVVVLFPFCVCQFSSFV